LILPDVNILVYAFRSEAALHGVCKSFLDSALDGTEPFCVSPQVLSSVIRIVTNSKIFPRPDSTEAALGFANDLVSHPRCVIVQPGPRHWAIFCELCRHTKATGNLVPDAWFAALAIEHGCEWIPDDRDYALFPGLRWRSLREPVN
jgi:toxin-antitoxin system PIN domain toxin